MHAHEDGIVNKLMWNLLPWFIRNNVLTLCDLYIKEYVLNLYLPNGVGEINK